ncbi:C-C motif chemokine 5 [Acomys russatus]|uniref:C-C motif chemokine 5 n=1 Tax=Acomys russatus TaxID=60746 RepID=UPI0021E24C87|nr:C-C motif chemokine 5 [Acomys russatus]
MGIAEENFVQPSMQELWARGRTTKRFVFTLWVQGMGLQPDFLASASGTMKISVAALAVIVTAAAICTPASASPYFTMNSTGTPQGLLRLFLLPDGSDTTPCCFAYHSRVLPRDHVKEYFYTSSKCSNLAVVFVTRRNRQVCANPEKKWVRKYINYLEMK